MWGWVFKFFDIIYINFFGSNKRIRKLPKTDLLTAVLSSFLQKRWIDTRFLHLLDLKIVFILALFRDAQVSSVKSN